MKSVHFYFKIIAMFFICIPAFSQTPVKTFRLDQDLEIRQFDNNVYVVTHSFPWTANSMFVGIDNRNIVFVDTPYTPEASEQVLAWIDTHIGKRNIICINTGFHFDNLGGNKAFISKGIPVYGARETIQLINERGEAARQLFLGWLGGTKFKRFYDTYRTLLYTPPNTLFSLQKGLELKIGNETIQVIFPGETHSPDNTVVYFANRRLLFGGCMILSGDKPGNTEDANIAQWPVSIKKLKNLNVSMVVPGHGLRFDSGLIEHTILVLEKNTH
ncbi:MAG: MBL fold metallo-hydrolase [Spirochaetales bacterium]|nr:MBL fold metallo-hydrolase [Spirochaetales bacterium]